MTNPKKTTTAGTAVVEQKSTEIVPVKNEIVKNDADIDGFIAKRQAFITKVNSICVEGKDYHVIQGRKSLAKGGAEKIASIFHWKATFSKDTESLEMLGIKEGLVAFKCSLVNGDFVGEGRGAASLSKNSGDPNKTLKMAQKSAFIDAVLRASGLSDFFTQDLEDMPREQIGQHQEEPRVNVQTNYKLRTESFKPSEKQLELIGKLCNQKGYTKEDILDQGFTKLTGGKEGTASELIDWLMKAPTKINPAGEPVSQNEDAYTDEHGNTVVTDKNTGETVKIPF